MHAGTKCFTSKSALLILNITNDVNVLYISSRKLISICNIFFVQIENIRSLINLYLRTCLVLNNNETNSSTNKEMHNSADVLLS